MVRNVAIYARVSTEHEAQLSALENQIQYYDNILAMHPDWKLYKRYIDEGITGTSVKKRKNFMQMLEDAENGCFDLIITREVSRFARNTVDTLQETRKLKKIGVEVYFTEDNIWTMNDEDGELKLTLMATLAQNESKKTSQRVKAGQKISFENGVFYGNGNILGYDKVGQEMIINEEQARTVRFIFSSFLKGDGTTKIKYELEKRGYLTATGLKTWSAACITRILQNPFYCGIIVYRKNYIPDYLEQKPQKNKGQVEQIIVEGRHQPIISKEDFEKVQKILSARSIVVTNSRNRNKMVGHGLPKSVWTKKLICTCGSTFNKTTYHKDKTGENKTYCYQCYKQKNMGSLKTRLKRGLSTDGACDTSLVQEWKLELMSNVIFNFIWGDKERIVDIANKLIDDTINNVERNDDVNLEIQSNLSKIENYNKKTEKLVEMYLNEMLDKDEYINKKKDMLECIEALKKRNLELEKQRSIPLENLEEKVRSIKQCILDNLDFSGEIISEEIVESIVEYIKVKNDGFEWKLNYLSGIISVGVEGRQSNPVVNLYNETEKKTLVQNNNTSCN